MDMEQVMQTFIVESNDLLTDMEGYLLKLEEVPEDQETLDALFRAVHTIKGSSGIFGLDLVVTFTHRVESLLEVVREGEKAITPDMIALLLRCTDHMEELIEVLAIQKGDVDVTSIENGQALMTELDVFLQTDCSSPVVSDNENVQVTPGDTGAFDESLNNTPGNYHISIRFPKEILRNCMDPLVLINYLNSLGKVEFLKVLDQAIPASAEMDPENCYLGFEISFRSTISRQEIAEVFEFVQDDAVLHILSQDTEPASYIEMIRALPEDNMLLGEILVESGALSWTELEKGLCTQVEEERDAKDESDTRLIGEILVDQQAISKKELDHAVSKQADKRQPCTKSTGHINVSAEKLDHLITMVGELVIATASTGLLAGNTGQEELLESVATVSRLVEDIRGASLGLRMVAIGTTFSRFKRVIHDMSRELGKKIHLEIQGAETELDKTVIEKIRDPLMHLVRNAIDHGIEPEEIREQHGKSKQGLLKFNAFHDSGNIVIEVIDDGGGINTAHLYDKAVAKGIIVPGANMSEREINELIFHPGFSTAKEITNISGRGVGMDVVKRNIMALRGSIEVRSRVHEGTTIRINLPLTLAIIDGFLVDVSGVSYVIPLDMVMECVDMHEHIDALEARDYINLRGEVLPLIRLGRQFGSNEAGVAKGQSIVVVRSGMLKAGLIVDKLLGELQAVIKPLGTIFNGLKGISGSTILGSGDVALILDIPNLVKITEQREVDYFYGSCRRKAMPPGTVDIQPMTSPH